MKAKPVGKRFPGERIHRIRKESKHPTPEHLLRCFISLKDGFVACLCPATLNFLIMVGQISSRQP
jgi:hypothetical protein